MALALRAALMPFDRSVHDAQATTVERYIMFVENINEHTEWALLITTARKAGLEKQDLCGELSCAWSTVIRWSAGQTMPGPITRTAIKSKLLRMLGELRQGEERLARLSEYA